jgi:hypothetical protein
MGRESTSLWSHIADKPASVLTDIFHILEILIMDGKVPHIYTNSFSEIVNHVHIEAIRDMDVDVRMGVLGCVHLGKGSRGGRVYDGCAEIELVVYSDDMLVML